MPMPNELRARSEEGKKTPNGLARSQPFKAQLRAETIIWQESERNKVDGYASIVGRKYDMWDMFGEYTELVMPGAFDETLAAKPDVAFLTNHRGVTMARTTNGSLQLSADNKGLHSLAYLNPKRNDVKDLIIAIEDKDITEMSFAFMITDGEWNEDYTEYQINSVDLDRGDVSAVNFGANPYTSVKARQQEVMRDFAQIPQGAQRAAILASGVDLSTLRQSDREDTDKADTDFLLAEQWMTQHSINR